jgi:hypothetical protein
MANDPIQTQVGEYDGIWNMHRNREIAVSAVQPLSHRSPIASGLRLTSRLCSTMAICTMDNDWFRCLEPFKVRKPFKSSLVKSVVTMRPGSSSVP